MNAMLMELKELFRREKVYFYLLVAMVTFYGVVLTANRMMPEKMFVTDQDLQDIEVRPTVPHQMPQAPHEIQERWSRQVKTSWRFKISNYLLLGAIGLGIWLGLGDLFRWFRKKEVMANSAGGLNIGWGISDVIKVIILFFLCGLVLNIGLVTVKFIFSKAAPGAPLILAQAFVLDVIAVFLMIGVIRKHGSTFHDLMGFRLAKISLSEIWLGIRTYFVILPIFVAMLIVLVLIVTWLAYQPPPHPLVHVFLKEEHLSPWLIASSMLLACFVGPVVEEIFFRGFLYPALRRYWGIPLAMTVTAALFALVHENLFAFFPIFFLGLVLTYLYQKRGNLVPCISLHVVHNVAFITYFFLVRSILTG